MSDIYLAIDPADARDHDDAIWAEMGREEAASGDPAASGVASPETARAAADR